MGVRLYTRILVAVLAFANLLIWSALLALEAA